VALAVYVLVEQSPHALVVALRNLPAAQPQAVLAVAEHAVTVAGRAPEQVVQAVGQAVWTGVVPGMTTEASAW